MTAMCSLSRICLVLLGFHFLTGCGGVSALIASEEIPSPGLDPAASFYVAVPEGASPEERKAAQAFAAELASRGLNVISESDKAGADFVVALRFSGTTSVVAGALPISQSQSSVIRNVNGLEVGVVRSESTTDLVYSKHEGVRRVDVSLARSDSGLPVWSGSIEAGAGVFSRHVRCIVRELVGRLGRGFSAPVRIDTACLNRYAR